MAKDLMDAMTFDAKEAVNCRKQIEVTIPADVVAAEAEKAYTSAANNAAYQEPVRAEAAYLLGCLYVAKNDNEKAQAAFKRAIISNPTSQTTAYWSQLASRAMDRLPAGK